MSYQTLEVPLRGRISPGCALCADRLVEQIRRLFGVTNATVDSRASTLSVAYDPNHLTPDAVQAEAGRIAETLAEQFEHRTYRIGGMDCANCAASVEKSVKTIPGVVSASVAFTTARLKVEQEREASARIAETIEGRVRDLGFSLHHDVRTSLPVVTSESPTHEHSHSHEHGDSQGNEWLRVGLAGGLLAVALLLEHVFHAPHVAVALASLGSVVIGGYQFAHAGFRALKTRTVGTNLLMALAAVGAMFLGAWEEAAAVVFLYALGETLEASAMDKTRRSLAGLIDSAPTEAQRLLPGGQTETVAASLLAVGDTILVPPGAKVAADGLILSGTSEVAEAALTGEALPRTKVAGETVYAGSVNGSGAMTVRVTAPGDDTTLARILHLVEEAQASKAPVQAMVEKFGEIYTPLVIVAAVLLAVIGSILVPGTTYLYRALTLLVVACPCALVIATPVAYVSGIARAARIGLLVKGGAILEALATARRVALDKTGTLTTGTFRIESVIPFGITEDELLTVAASVETQSEHPIAKAVVNEATRRGLAGILPTATNVTAVAGRGVTATVNGESVLVGTRQLLVERGVTVPDASDDATTLYIAKGNRTLGYLSAADTVRPEAASAVADLKQLGLTPTMLTGDAEPVARRVGEAVGISDVAARLLPEDKLRRVETLSAQGGVLFVGDGINDAPALASATVGVAMGAGGTAAALEAADLALMQGDLSRLPSAVRLARATRAIVRQNIVIAVGAVLVLLGSTFAGVLPLPLGVLVHEGSALLVILNGLRLLSPRLTRL